MIVYIVIDMNSFVNPFADSDDEIPDDIMNIANKIRTPGNEQDVIDFVRERGRVDENEGGRELLSSISSRLTVANMLNAEFDEVQKFTVMVMEIYKMRPRYYYYNIENIFSKFVDRLVVFEDELTSNDIDKLALPVDIFLKGVTNNTGLTLYSRFLGSFRYNSEPNELLIIKLFEIFNANVSSQTLESEFNVTLNLIEQDYSELENSLEELQNRVAEKEASISSKQTLIELLDHFHDQRRRKVSERAMTEIQSAMNREKMTYLPQEIRRKIFHQLHPEKTPRKKQGPTKNSARLRF